MVLNEKYDFLKDVNLSELKGKDDDFVIFKGIKFNKEERELLQFIQWKGEKFSNYVKQLIEKDMRETVENFKQEVDVSTTSTVPVNLDENYIMELIDKVLDARENKNRLEKEVVATEITEEDKIVLGALGNLGINRR